MEDKAQGFFVGINMQTFTVKDPHVTKQTPADQRVSTCPMQTTEEFLTSDSCVQHNYQPSAETEMKCQQEN